MRCFADCRAESFEIWPGAGRQREPKHPRFIGQLILLLDRGHAMTYLNQSAMTLQRRAEVC